MRRVLIVEDEDLQRTTFVRALSKLEDCRVTGVGSVGAALTAIDLEPPDVIVSDIGLPDRLGVALIAELDSRGIAVPLLFVTADVQTFRHLVPPTLPLMEKPVSLALLRETIRQLLDRVVRPAGGEAAQRLVS